MSLRLASLPIAALLLVGVPFARAQEIAPASTQAADPAPAWPKITLHGYLTQAYARSDGNQILGIPEDGTANYRTAALQFRADISLDDTFIVQFSHEQFGASKLRDIKPEVDLDWLFYQHRFGNSSVQIGRVQIPFGIYNEVRDVGILLPFYRPSANFYGEGSIASETVDGIVLSHLFRLGDGWELSGDLHYGNWDFLTDAGTLFVRQEAKDSVGIELWLETPVPGLRIGVGSMRFDVIGRGQTWETSHLSAEAELGPITTRVEFRFTDFEEGTNKAGYAQVGVKLGEKLAINGQLDRSRLKGISFQGEFDDDRALGLNYSFRPDLILKLEHHWDEGHLNLSQESLLAPAVKTRYGILSLSTSF
jgi:hypothetical protein